MGAKRAVAGRSLPYDMLLAAYQKKNQAKQQSKSTQRALHVTDDLLTFYLICRGCARCQRAARGRGRSQCGTCGLRRGNSRRHERAGALEPAARGATTSVEPNQETIPARTSSRAAANGHKRWPNQYFQGCRFRCPKTA